MKKSHVLCKKSVRTHVSGLWPPTSFVLAPFAVVTKKPLLTFMAGDHVPLEIMTSLNCRQLVISDAL